MMSQQHLIEILQADIEARGDQMLSIWIWDRKAFNATHGSDMIETQWTAGLVTIDDVTQRLMVGEDARVLYSEALEELGYVEEE